MAKKEINTRITIAASTEKTWKILMDFPAYDKWNPFIKSIAGLPKLGNTKGRKKQVFVLVFLYL